MSACSTCGLAECWIGKSRIGDFENDPLEILAAKGWTLLELADLMIESLRWPDPPISGIGAEVLRRHVAAHGREHIAEMIAPRAS